MVEQANYGGVAYFLLRTQKERLLRAENLHRRRRVTTEVEPGTGVGNEAGADAVAARSGAIDGTHAVSQILAQRHAVFGEGDNQGDEGLLRITYS